MATKDLQISLEDATRKDIPALTDVMTRAFDDDAQKHLGIERGGPPGYDNGDFFREWLFGYEESDGYKIIVEGQVVGGFIVWDLESKDNILGTIFIDPDYQDMGIGTKSWGFIKDRYPQAKSWTLETPIWAVKNHHFYGVKCGFQQVGTNEDSIIFKKILKR
jgi:GNAT superfamily N-acetyltransferase